MLVELLFCSKYFGSVVVFIKICWYSCCFVRSMFVELLFCLKCVYSVILFEV